MAERESAEGIMVALLPIAHGDVERPASREAGESNRGGFVKGVWKDERQVNCHVPVSIL